MISLIEIFKLNNQQRLTTPMKFICLVLQIDKLLKVSLIQISLLKISMPISSRQNKETLNIGLILNMCSISSNNNLKIRLISARYSKITEVNILRELLAILSKSQMFLNPIGSNKLQKV